MTYQDEALCFWLDPFCVYSECHRMSHLHKVTGSWVLCWWRDGTHETSVVKNRRKHWRDPSPMQERAKHDCMAAWIFWMCIESTEEQAWYAIYARENGENWREYHRLPCSFPIQYVTDMKWEQWERVQDIISSSAPLSRESRETLRSLRNVKDSTGGWNM